MAEDPLAEVIAAVVDDDMWENRHRPLFAQRTAAAVRAHTAAVLANEEAWFGFTRHDKYAKGVHDTYSRVRSLLGTTEETTGG